MRDKSWPYFNDWGVIFGKDRATGEFAIDVEDMVGDAEVEASMREVENIEAHNPVAPNVPASSSATHGGDQPPSMEPSVASPCPNKRKKAKVSGNASDSIAKSLGDISKVFGEYVQESRKQLDSIAHRVGYMHDVSDARKRVNAELEKINGLSMVDRHAALFKICSDPVKVDIFFSLPDYERPTWVGGLLWHTPQL